MTGATPEALPAVLGQLVGPLERLGIRDFAVTGSVALGVWAAPRETRDIDLCGVLPAASVDRLLAQHDGMRFGPGELPDVLRFRVGAWDVDLFVSKGAYDRNCLDRAVEADIGGCKIRVVTPEDLLIHKLFKLRTDRRRVLQDVADIRAVLDARGTSVDVEYLRRWLSGGEFELFEAFRRLDDDAVLDRLRRS